MKSTHNDPPRLLSELRREISHSIHKANDTTQGLAEIINRIVRYFRADAGAIFLVNANTNLLEGEAQVHFEGNEKITLPLGLGIPGWVVWHAQPALVAEVSLDARYRALRDLSLIHI